MAYGPEVFLLNLSHGGLQLLKPGRVGPNTGCMLFMFTTGHGRENYIMKPRALTYQLC